MTTLPSAPAAPGYIPNATNIPEIDTQSPFLFEPVQVPIPLETYANVKSSDCPRRRRPTASEELLSGNCRIGVVEAGLPAGRQIDRSDHQLLFTTANDISNIHRGQVNRPASTRPGCSAYRPIHTAAPASSWHPGR